VLHQLVHTCASQLQHHADHYGDQQWCKFNQANTPVDNCVCY
jgi:hypothetical protein